jgi:hypothetical protein
LIIHGKCHDTPLTFAINIFTGKYGWSFTNPMCYFCKTSDLSEIGRVENFKKDFIKIFGIEPDKSRNKIDRPDIYVQFPQLRHMVSRLYMEDFIEFKYPLDPFIYKQVPVPWTIEDVEKIEKKCSQDDYTSSGSIFDEIPLSKMIT